MTILHLFVRRMREMVNMEPINPIVAIPAPRVGARLNTSNLHSKHPSSIAQRLKTAGVDWIVDLAAAIKANDKDRIALWMRMLPYLVVTQGHRKIKRMKGKASKAALAALEDLEGR